MKGGTGVFIDGKNAEQNFIEFLENSEIEYLARGTYGMTFRIIIPNNSNYVSKYKHIDSSNYGKEVKSILLKLSVLGFNTSNIDVPIDPISKDDFIREVNLQTEIFLKTMDTLQPLCPAIVYSKLYENDNSVIDLIIDKLKDQHRKQQLSYLKSVMNGYSIIGMELINNYETMYSIMNNINYKKKEIVYRHMLLFLLIQLALKTGYSHADFHDSNVMINPNDTSYFKGISGAPILIDFGLTTKIPIPLLDTLKHYYENKQYNRIIGILCDIPRADGYNLRESTVYENVCKFTPNVNQMNHLFKLKEEATKSIIDLFNSKKQQRDKYPLLPLSNQIKNKMFPGLIENHEEIEIYKFDMPKEKMVGNNKIKIAKIMNLLFVWIIDCCKRELYPSSFKRVLNKTIFEYCVDISYMTAYLLLEEPEFTASINNFQKAAMVSMCASGMSNYMSSELRFNINLITPQELEALCNTYSDKLKHIKFNKITDFMTTKMIDEINQDLDEFKEEIITSEYIIDIDIYNDPKKWVKEHYSGNFAENENNVQPFEYQFPFQKQESIVGGKTCKRTKRRIKKTKKTKKLKRKCLKSKRFKLCL